MKFNLLLSSCLAALFLGAYPVVYPIEATAQTTQSVWKTFSPAAGRFTILMPGTPKQGKQTQTTEAGSIDTQMFMVERQQDATAYMVAYSDFPTSLVQQAAGSQAGLNQLFNGVRDGFVSSIRGKLLSQRSINLNGYPGVEIKIDLPRNRIARNRMYLVNQRLYQVVVVASKEKERHLTKSIEGFFNSFKLTSN